MRSIEDIAETGAGWVTEAELAMLCAFAKRAEQSEIELRKLGSVASTEQCRERVRTLEEHLEIARVAATETGRIVGTLRERVRTLEEALREVTRRAVDARRNGDYFAGLCDIPGIASAALREEGK